MSDYYRNHNQSSDPFQPPRNGAAEDAAPWDMPMDGPEMAQGMPAWQQPGVMGSGFLAEDPAPFGAEMQQSGVPLFQDAMDFRTQGDDAPTRVAKPLAQQMVNKRTTVGRGPGPFERPAAPVAQPAQPAPAPQPAPPAPAGGPEREEAPAPRRRRSRVAERAQEAAVEPPQPAPQEYDPFEAGDSEVPEAPRAERRAAVPGGRYTGARTAMPEGGPRSRSAAARPQEGDQPPKDGNASAPAPRRPAPRPAQPGRRPAPAQGQQPAPQGQRPAQPGRRPAPAQRPPQQRPAPQGQRPAQQAAMPPVGQRMAQAEMEGGAMPRRQAGPRQQPARPADEPFRRPTASVDRPRYDFEEDEDYASQEPERRRGGVLLPIVIALLVVGALLAGICLPDWEGMGGGIGSAIAPVKSTLVGAFTSVKNMIVPEEDPIKSFSAAAADSAAPTQVIFAVQTAKSVMGLRIVDDLGNTVYDGNYSTDKEASGEVISNSNVLLWKPSCTIEDAYSGGFTAYARRQDGVESEGFPVSAPVTISAPRVVAEPMQGFTCDTSISGVPAHLTFTLTTSTDVTAVRVVDSYNTPVVSMYLTDPQNEDATVTETGDQRIWTLGAEVTTAYSGSYDAQYQLDGELNFTPSGMSVDVQLGSEPVEEEEEEENY